MPDSSPNPTTYPERALKWTVFLGATALVLYLCLLILGPFLNVIAWSSVLAIAFHPVHRYLVRTTGHVALSAVLCSALVIVTILIPVVFVASVAIDQALALRDYLQQTPTDAMAALEPVRRVMDSVTGRFGIDAAAVVDWVRENASQLFQVSAGYSLAIAANVTNVLISFIFTIFAMFLLFRDGERIVSRIADLLPFERSRSEALLVHVRDVIYGSVYGVIVIALIQGALTGLMFRILGIPSAALWGSVTVLVSVLPIVGAAGVWVPGTLYLALTGQVTRAIVLAVVGTLLISGTDNFIRPRLVGGRVGLSELVMFFALLGGLQAFGILGIVLGPVLFAIVASIVDVLSDRTALAVPAASLATAGEPSKD